ncbi:hypothetical protein DLAC_00467 [Tieghemostelium lacteum]|uniref:Uncharacterized protein n=1 Tax=Tieghemostelium lacteum TaxID=361077 RepID=A0A152A9S8_TIELA|nr:hypothetical protein DLAC_00467 [Tieghemostelium lacteum]|eukprot:KYR02982.1 hypothetical protein DLAC_00467 [Tieghemostelium lacteum]
MSKYPKPDIVRTVKITPSVKAPLPPVVTDLLERKLANLSTITEKKNIVPQVPKLDEITFNEDYNYNLQKNRSLALIESQRVLVKPSEPIGTEEIKIETSPVVQDVNKPIESPNVESMDVKVENLKTSSPEIIATVEDIAVEEQHSSSPTSDNNNVNNKNTNHSNIENINNNSIGNHIQTDTISNDPQTIQNIEGNGDAHDIKNQTKVKKEIDRNVYQPPSRRNSRPIQQQVDNSFQYNNPIFNSSGKYYRYDQPQYNYGYYLQPPTSVVIQAPPLYPPPGLVAVPIPYSQPINQILLGNIPPSIQEDYFPPQNSFQNTEYHENNNKNGNKFEDEPNILDTNQNQCDQTQHSNSPLLSPTIQTVPEDISTNSISPPIIVECTLSNDSIVQPIFPSFPLIRSESDNHENIYQLNSLLVKRIILIGLMVMGFFSIIKISVSPNSILIDSKENIIEHQSTIFSLPFIQDCGLIPFIYYTNPIVTSILYTFSTLVVLIALVSYLQLNDSN